VTDGWGKPRANGRSGRRQQWIHYQHTNAGCFESLASTATGRFFVGLCTIFKVSAFVLPKKLSCKKSGGKAVHEIKQMTAKHFCYIAFETIKQIQ